jgi:glycerol-3-phosphate acyltransferase PlsY
MVYYEIIGLLFTAYLLGSIPSAVWIGKAMYGIDVREEGSKNAGATNTFRVLGKKAGIPVITLDILKGWVATMLAFLFTNFPVGGDDYSNLQIALGSMAVIGHIFPVFAGFRGGKGIATLFGMAIALNLDAAVIGISIFLIILITTHYVSLGSILTGIIYPFIIYFVVGANGSIVIFSICVAVLIALTHRKNIVRLMNGNENKIYLFGKKK